VRPAINISPLAAFKHSPHLFSAACFAYDSRTRTIPRHIFLTIFWRFIPTNLHLIKDPGQQSDQLTQEIAAGSYNLNIELDAQQLQLGPASKKVIAPFLSFASLIPHPRFCHQEGDTANYLLTVLLCEGECGSAHKWSRILAGNSSEFNVTKTK
jgi:hypothetical protein